MIIVTAATAVMMTAANQIKKFSYLNRINKEIRIKIRIKSIYDEATCFLSMHFIKKEINRQKAATDRFRLQSVYNRFFAVQQAHKTYFMICTHNSFTFTQQSHSDRTVCSALKITHIIFFDLIFFLYTYQERSFFFFFFSINLKKITICNADINLTEQQKSDSSNKADTVTATRKEIQKQDQL